MEMKRRSNIEAQTPEQLISRVLFLKQVSLLRGGNHSSRTWVTPCLQRPTRGLKTGHLFPLTGNALLFGLAPGGVCLADSVTRIAGELLPHRFTLTGSMNRRSIFCGTFLEVTLTGCYPAPCPVELGLSSRSDKGTSGYLFCSGVAPKVIIKFNYCPIREFGFKQCLIPARSK